MMTDQELLEYAAKAVGIEIHNTEFFSGPHLKGTTRPWNPLTSDADAFRLMVRLCLVVFPPDDDDPTAVVQGVGPVFHSLHITEVSESGNYRATTRRAIVRAAAEIGKCMTEEETLDS